MKKDEEKKIIISDIDWTDEAYEESDDLPTEIVIENPTEEQCKAIGGYTSPAVLDDYLYDLYGFWICGYSARVVD